MVHEAQKMHLYWNRLFNNANFLTIPSKDYCLFSYEPVKNMVKYGVIHVKIYDFNQSLVCEQHCMKQKFFQF